MESRRALLLIADIGGYTEYMSTHRMSLAHAEVNTARLLEKVVDAAGDFDLIEIEGDGVFLTRPVDPLNGDDSVDATVRAAAAMYRAFHLERQYVAANLCPCDGCSQVDNLKLKFVAHIGDVATQTVKQRRKVVGIDVILVHRMLKNPVDVPEYVLFSEELYRTGETPLGESAREISQDLEGIGEVREYFVSVGDVEDSTPPEVRQSIVGRVGRTFAVAGTGLPYMLGLRRRRRTASPN